MQKVTLDRTWSILLGEPLGDLNYWVDKKKIPLGTLKPFEMYDGGLVPEEDIVTIDFDDVETSSTSRKALNMLILGGSGDGKSLLMKTIWSVLHESGYYCGYIDPKCQSGEDRILLSDGRYVKLKDAPDNGYIVSINQDTLKNEVKEYKKISKNQRKFCYKIRTKFGSEIYCSEDHPFMTGINAWKPIKELKVGDFVALTRDIPYFGNNNVSEHEIKIIAYLLCDGSISSEGTYGYTKGDKFLVDDLSEAVSEIGCRLELLNNYEIQYRIYQKAKKQFNHKSPIRKLLEKYGLFKTLSRDKKIPEDFFTLPKDKLSLFLNRLFSGDGSIFRVKSGVGWRYHIKYSSASKELCLQIKHLLLRYGIISCVYSENRKGYDQDYYVLGIQNARVIKKFIDVIGFFGEKNSKAEEWYDDISSIKSNCFYDKVPVKRNKESYYTRHYYQQRPKDRRSYDPVVGESDIFWDTISSIEDVGVLPTYDLSVKDNENYISNDFITHNSTDSGRARSGWKSNRLPPHMDAKGIDLQHFMPVWSLQNFEHLAHNFRHYSTRLSKISEREMWQGLGMTNIGASKTAKIIKRYINEFGDISMSDLKEEIFNLSKEDLPSGSADAVIRVLTDMEDYEVVDDGVPELKLWNEWKKGYSVCISYNSASRILMTFDIGMKIRESARLYFQGNRNPVMWFFDDASYYAKEMKVVPFNFAVQEIKEIGFNYRSLGVYNVLAVQSLGIIDENVAETYKIKIISPLFQSVDQLSSINVPKKAIDYLRNGVLVKDKKRYLMQYLLVDEDNEVIPFFPFTPPVNHFSEVYHEKNQEAESSE